MRSFCRLFMAFGCMTVLAFPQSRSEEGPFCWAGVDRDGKDKFVACKPKHHRTINLYVDNQGTFDDVNIHTKDGYITVSRERFLKALGDWAAENHAKF